MFRFASKLVGQTEYPGADDLSITIRLSGTKDRVLDARDSRCLRDRYRGTSPRLEKAWSIEAAQLCTDADELAVKAAVWLFERFNWHDEAEEGAKKIQSSIFSKYPR